MSAKEMLRDHLERDHPETTLRPGAVSHNRLSRIHGETHAHRRCTHRHPREGSLIERLRRAEPNGGEAA